MADQILTYVLDETLTSQILNVPSGAQPLRAHRSKDQVRLDVIAEPTNSYAAGLRVWLLPEDSVTGRIRKEWYKGSIATRAGKVQLVFAEPLSGSGIDNYGPLVWAGAWLSTRDYTVDEIVANSSGALYRCFDPILGDAANPEPGGGGAWSDNWELVIDSSSTVADGSITEAKLANNAVTTAKLASGAVTGGQLANGAVSEGKIGNYQVSSIKIDTGAVTAAKIADSNVTESKLASNAVTSAKIGALAVDGTKILDGAVTESKLGAGAVATGKLQDSAVTASKLGSNAVTTDKILNSNVTTDKLATGAVTSTKIASGGVANWNLNTTLEAKLRYKDEPDEPFMPWTGEVVGTWSNRRAYNPLFLDRFMGRGSELAMDLDGTAVGTTNIQNLTNQSYGNALNVATAGGNTGVLTIDLVTNGMVSSNGFTYAQGYLTLTFYSGRGPVSMSCRTQDKNGTWTNRTCTAQMTSSSTPGATEAVYWSIQIGGNYLTKIEITMTSQSGQVCGLGNISYLGTRMQFTQGPQMTTLGGNFYGTISGVEQGTTNWSINQDGDADVTSLDVTNNIIVGGTVDGRDIATDGSKLDGIDTGATSDENLGNADQTLTASRTIDDGNNGYLFFVDLEDTGKKSQILMNPGNPNILVQANDTGAGNVTAFTVGSENLNLQFTGTSDLRVNNDAGSSGQVLTSNGTGNAPSWETPGAVIFAAGDVTSQTVTTSYAVVTTNSPSINTAGITFSSSVFTVPAALAGKYISFAMTLDASQTSGNNRVELDLALQKFNGSTWDDIMKITNYAQRANSHDSGGVTMAESFDLSGTLSGGEQYRWRVRQAGSPTTVTSVLSSYTIKVYP